MKKEVLLLLTLSMLALALIACENETEILDENVKPEVERVGFELVEIASFSNFLVWINEEPLTQAQFDSIDLSFNWTKNQPREGEPDGGRFLRSPDAAAEGVFTSAEHFGFRWLFNAQIVEQNVPLPDNEEGLLTGRNIAKYHEVKFHAGRTIYVLVSPEGEEYIRISRDAYRTIETAEIPASWRIEERVLEKELNIELPNPTLNIRSENNQDSFQGPVDL
ncbi:MAG: hypothetical protein AAFR87_08685 [Bacteroidota bacterium]